jgi:hypothetical protein
VLRATDKLINELFFDKQVFLVLICQASKLSQIDRQSTISYTIFRLLGMKDSLCTFVAWAGFVLEELLPLRQNVTFHRLATTSKSVVFCLKRNSLLLQH